MSKIRECFKSRFGSKGFLVEADLSQIEVVCLAFLSQDKQMMKDIKDGVDFHCKRLAYKSGMHYEDVWTLVHIAKDPYMIAERKKIKSVSFQKSYGAGAKAISEALGLDLNEVKKILDTEDKLYPGVGRWQELMLEHVEEYAMITKEKSPLGFPIKVSTIDSITGKFYTFKERDLPEELKEWKNKEVDFSPTEIKNYPVQGLAADLIKLALGILYRRIKNEKFDNKALLINTVHDSILLDVHESVLEDTCKLVKGVLEGLPSYFETTYDVEFNLPIKCEVSYGRDWMNQNEFKFTN